MGLDCSHGAWTGSYIVFHLWRKVIASAAGLPPLELMEGFYRPLNSTEFSGPTLYHGPQTNKASCGFGDRPYLADIDQGLPIKWESLKESALHELLYHSDCDGQIEPDRCGPIADSLEKLLPNLNDEHRLKFRSTTIQFIDGLREAAASNEPLEFF